MTNKSYILLFTFLFFLKIFSIYFTNFSLYGDEAQYWLWSKNLDTGYFSKPPLLAWFIRLYSYLFGSDFISIKIFPSIVYIFTSISIYLLCIELSFTKKNALTCSLMFIIMPAVSLSSFLISTDVLLLFFWTVSLIYLIKIRKDPGVFNFILLGIFLGLSFLSKYAAVYFFLCLFLFIFFDDKFKEIVFKNIFGFFVFVLSFLVVISPNILWNIKNDWLTFGHTASNANLTNISFNFLGGFEFLLAQILMVGPILFFGFLLNIKSSKFVFQNIFLLCFSLPIMFIVLIESVLVRANANWAAPGLICLLIFFFNSLNKFKQKIISLNFVLNFFVGAILYFLISISSPVSFFDRIRGLENFSKEIAEISDLKTIVISDRILFSSLSYELKNEEYYVYMPYYDLEGVTNHFQMSTPLDKNISNDFILIGSPLDIKYLINDYKIKLKKNFNEPFHSEQIDVYEVTF